MTLFSFNHLFKERPYLQGQPHSEVLGARPSTYGLLEGDTAAHTMLTQLLRSLENFPDKTFSFLRGGGPMSGPGAHGSLVLAGRGLTPQGPRRQLSGQDVLSRH